MKTIMTFAACYVLITFTSRGSDLFVPLGTTNYVNQVYRPLATGTYTSQTNVFGLDMTRGQGFFTNNDYCLIIQVRDDSPTNNNSAGLWEIANVVSVGSNTVLLARFMMTGNEYRQDAIKRAIIVKYECFSSVTVSGTISCASWDGYVGGLVAFSASSLTVCSGGCIDVARRGFRPAGNVESSYAENYNAFVTLGSGNGANGTSGGGGNTDMEGQVRRELDQVAMAALDD